MLQYNILVLIIHLISLIYVRIKSLFVIDLNVGNLLDDLEVNFQLGHNYGFSGNITN